MEYNLYIHKKTFANPFTHPENRPLLAHIKKMQIKIEVRRILMFLVVMYTTSYLFNKIALLLLQPYIKAFYHKMHSSPALVKGEEITRTILMLDFIRNTIFPLQIISLTTFILLLAVKAWRSAIKEFVIAYIVLMVLLIVF